MLDRAHRLRRRDEFTAAVRRGRRVGRGTLVVHLLPGEPPAESGDRASAPATARAGFIVSRAVGPAVVRNRVRRRLRHLVRPRLATLPAGTLLAVRALPAAAAASADQLARDLDEALATACAPRFGRRADRTGAAARAHGRAGRA